ncbi:hypothetical protein [Psychrobacter sp. I-STPA10]|uniref:hypothetical protein n=1 Tax=Psychrobacter sp. I-STPA10 TaxID=2585769 RepID=UPI001E284714|nr:hypothetical protein [Psychrobacter sp. I-STPA10]
MSKLYEYTSQYHRDIETLRVRTCGQGIYLGINSIVQMPFNQDDNEQTTSIVLPLSEVLPLIEALSKSIYDKDSFTLVLNSYQVQATISALEFYIKMLDGINTVDAMPYELVEALKTMFDDLIKKNKEI